MATPTLIYCAAGSPRMAEIAVNAGYKYGARLPDTVYQPLYFADQDWRNPDRGRYMAALAEHRPHMATVLDWDDNTRYEEVMSWAEEAAQYVEVVVVVPKIPGTIQYIPEYIGNAEIVLGYSVPTKFSGTPVPMWEFLGCPVHLLGGTPQKQMELARYLYVYSADGNMANKMAVRYCAYWENGTGLTAKSRWWTQLQPLRPDGCYEAFAISCRNIMAAWCNAKPQEVGV